MKVFLTNLGKYNEGELVGTWLELPADEEDIDDALEAIGIDYERYEEYFITDYDTDIEGMKIGEYDSLEDLNEIAEEIESLDSYDKEIVEALVSEGGYSIDAAIDAIDSVLVYPDCYTMRDVALNVAEECGLFDGASDVLRRYFDYEAYGRDLEIEGEFYYHNGNYYNVF